MNLTVYVPLSYSGICFSIIFSFLTLFFLCKYYSYCRLKTRNINHLHDLQYIKEVFQLYVRNIQNYCKNQYNNLFLNVFMGKNTFSAINTCLTVRYNAKNQQTTPSINAKHRHLK